AVANATTPTNGLAPLTVSFSGAASSDPDNDPLTYTWTFGDGTTATGVTTSHRYTVKGVYSATLRVSDGRGGTSTSTPIVVTVGNRAPTPAISAPLDGMLYTAGDTIAFAGSATDPEDGALPASAFHWSVIFHHETHTHGFIDAIDGV